MGIMQIGHSVGVGGVQFLNVSSVRCVAASSAIRINLRFSLSVNGLPFSM